MTARFTTSSADGARWVGWHHPLANAAAMWAARRGSSTLRAPAGPSSCSACFLMALRRMSKPGARRGRMARRSRYATSVERTPEMVFERRSLPTEPALREPWSRIHSNMSSSEPAL
eukprot:1415929-Prymnesium_polylepis.2